MRTPTLIARIAFFGLSAATCTVLTACGSTSSGTPASVSTPQPVTVTATHTVAAKPAHAAPARNVAKQVTKPKRTKTKVAAASSTMWTMPNELGHVLQNAQDDLQRVSGDPVFVSHSHDLLGDRFQILDSDWQVCTQNVAPGTRVGQFAHIDFGVVKTYEQCP